MKYHLNDIVICGTSTVIGRIDEPINNDFERFLFLEKLETNLKIPVLSLDFKKVNSIATDNNDRSLV